MKANVPLEFSDLVSSDGDPLDLDGPDKFLEFLEAAALGANLGPGGAQHAHNFALEIQPINARFAAHYRGLAEKATAKKKVIADEEVLAKSGTPSARRLLSLKQFLKSRLAVGDSVEDVVRYAMRHDPDTGNLLREIAATL